MEKKKSCLVQTVAQLFSQLHCHFSSVLWFVTLSAVLTIKGHDKHADGDNPGDPAVGLSKLLHKVLEEDAEALDGAVGERLHQEEGPSHHPSPASIGGFWVHVGPQETWPLDSTQRHALQRETTLLVLKEWVSNLKTS